MVFNRDLELIHQPGIESPISHIRYLNHESKPGIRKFLLTFIGNLNPSDAPFGSVISAWYEPDTETAGMDSIVTTGIARPVVSKLADLDQDGLEDFIINEFGHRAGSLFWLRNRRGKEPEKKVIGRFSGLYSIIRFRLYRE